MSVIIPTIRLDADFFAALHSIFKQDYERVETIVVLDGIEPDGELSAHADARRLTVLRLDGQHGTPQALNAGLAAANGTYIARLDADDIAHPARISRQVLAMESKKHLAALGTYCEIIDAAGNVQGTFSPPSGDLRTTLLRRNPLVHSSMMFRASILKDVGGYNTDCTRMQDYELYLRLARAGGIEASPEFLTQYRVHSLQSSRRSPVISKSTAAILRARWRLAEHLRFSRLRTGTYIVGWLTWQALRQSGILKPRIARSVKNRTRDEPHN